MRSAGLKAGSPEAFLTPFLAERIDRHELDVVEADGKIEATGECRVDELRERPAKLADEQGLSEPVYVFSFDNDVLVDRTT